MGFKLTVEVPMFMSVFSYMLLANINTNLIIFRTCYVTLGYNKSECAKLGMSSDNATAALEKIVEPYADVIGMVRGIVEGLAGSILCVFVAPWSDRFGRKPILVLGAIGGTLMNLIIAAFAYFDTLSPWYMMLDLVPWILTGGGPAFLTVMMAYLTDTTDERHRGFRMGIFEGCLTISVILGTLSSAYMLKATNYTTMYLISAVCQLSAVFYTMFFIPESLQVQETQESKFRGLFQLTNIKDMLKTAFKRREHRRRTAILLLVISLSLYYVCVGANGIQFLWLRAKFSWTLVKYNWFQTACNLLSIPSTILIIYILHHRLKVTEMSLIVFGFCGLFVGNMVSAFATKDWHIYLSYVIKLSGSGMTPLTHSFMSKQVQQSEVAKILSIFNVANSIIALFGNPMFTSFYNYTLNKKLDSGLFNFITSGIHFLNFFITGTILFVTKRNVDGAYASLTNEGNSIINSDTGEVISADDDDDGDGTSNSKTLII